MDQAIGAANLVTLDEYNDLYRMGVKFRPVGFELASFMTRPPMGNGLAAAVNTQECMIRLGGTFASFQDGLSHLATLVGLTANMVSHEDRVLAVAVTMNDISGFLAQSKTSQQMINATMQTSKCAQDGATTAKSQEIKRLISEGTALVQSLATRLGVKPIDAK
ncbi:hypothetical protein [Bradyrhizobium sp. RT6a]